MGAEINSRQAIWCIIVPCFNEARQIGSTLEAIEAYCRTETECRWVIVAIDDGSVDTTVQMITAWQSAPQVSGVTREAICLPKNEGKGSAIIHALGMVDADYYGYLDADLSIDIASYFPLVKQKLSVADIVIGERKSFRPAGYSLWRALGSRFFQALARALFRLPWRDLQCGFKWFNRRGLEAAISVARTRYSFDLEFLIRAHKRGLTVASIPVSWRHRFDSRVGFADAMRYVLDMIPLMDVAYSARTFRVFSALLAIGASVLLFGWTIPYGYFFSDDFTWLWYGSRILNGELSILARMSTFFSPVVNVFYTVFLALFGATPAWYFAAGIIIHSTVAYLAGWLTHKLSGSGAAGLIAVALVAAVGGAYEPLVWIGANMHSLVALWITLSCALLVASFTNKKRCVWSLAGSFVASGLAIGTKEVAVITPILLAFVLTYFWLRPKETIETTRAHWVYAGCAALLFTVYGVFQYLWQSEGVWVGSGAWELSFASLLRLPTALLDVLVPLGPVLTHKTAVPVFLFACVLYGYVLYRFRRLPLVWFGFLWATLAALPVIFFAADNWYEVLPSRYTYTVRIGISILAAVVMRELLEHAQTIRLAHKLLWVMVVASSLQVIFMAYKAGTEYEYVYATGRSLEAAARDIGEHEVKRVFVNSYRPFPKNNAHIVGAVHVFAGIKEPAIVFLADGGQANLAPGDALLQWRDRPRGYEVIYQNL